MEHDKWIMKEIRDNSKHRIKWTWKIYQNLWVDKSEEHNRCVCQVWTCLIFGNGWRWCQERWHMASFFLFQILNRTSKEAFGGWPGSRDHKVNLLGCWICTSPTPHSDLPDTLPSPKQYSGIKTYSWPVDSQSKQTCIS
jgi:hypothetical protein